MLSTAYPRKITFLRRSWVVDVRHCPIPSLASNDQLRQVADLLYATKHGGLRNIAQIICLLLIGLIFPRQQLTPLARLRCGILEAEGTYEV